MRINHNRLLEDVKVFMAEKKLTNSKMAGSLGVSRQALYYWFVGRNKPPQAIIILLLSMLNRKPEDYKIMGDNND